MIKTQAVSGVMWTSVASLGGNLLQLVQLVLVTRLISATDYGLMALTLVITYFAQLFGDMGISNALIYKQHLKQSTFSSLFWVSLLLSWLVFAILFFISPWLAGFFHQPVLKNVLRTAALVFTFLPLQLLYVSVLRIRFQFRQLAFTELSSKLIALVVAVILALEGQGVFALVYSTLAGVASSALLYAYFGSREVKLSLVCRRSDLQGYLHFGGFQAANDLLNHFNFQIDTFLLGRLVGVDAVGLYAFAKNLALKPTQIINPVITQVAFPIMAKVNNSEAIVRNIYLKMLSYLASINFLIYPFLAATAETIIRLFFGTKWLGAAPVLNALAIYCMIRSVFNPVGVLMSARGMVERSFYWNLAILLVIPATVFFSFSAGIVWVGFSLVCLVLLLFIPMWKFLLLPACGATLNECWQCVRIPLFNAMSIYGLLSLYNLFSISNPIAQFAGSVLLWLTSSFLLTVYLNKKTLQELLNLLRHKSQEQPLLEN